MNKLIIFLALIPCLLCVKPSLKNALRNQVIIDFKNAIVPIISKQVEHLILPDIHTKSDGFDIDVTNIHVNITPFHPNQINIVFVPNSCIIQFSGAAFSMGGSAHIHAKWKFISKSMDADIGVKNTGFACQIQLLSHGGKPNIQVDSVHISLTGGDVSIHIHGDIINKILEFIANLLKGHFVSQIVGQLQSKLPPVITTTVNSKLNTLPSDVALGSSLNLKYGFPFNPYVKDQYLFTAISGFVHPKDTPNPPPYEPSDMPEFDGANPKGIQFFFGDYIVKSSIDSLFSLGLMTVAFQKHVLDHDIKMVCKATKSPKFDFINAIDVTVSAYCDVNFDADPKNKFGLKAEVHVNMKEYMKAAVIFFTIVEAKFTQLEYVIENPIDINWFKDGVNTVLAVIVEIINADLGQRGIPLPTIQGIDYTDTSQYVKQGYIEICTTPVFHFSAQEEDQ